MYFVLRKYLLHSYAQNDKLCLLNYIDHPDKYNHDYEYVRILLGMADHYELNGDINIYNFSENDKDVKIDRFKSPVTIKIINSTIVFIFNESAFQSVLGKNFYFIRTKKLDSSRYKDLRTEQDKEDYIKNNGVVVGCSAGAVICGKDIDIISSKDNLTKEVTMVKEAEIDDYLDMNCR